VKFLALKTAFEKVGFSADSYQPQEPPLPPPFFSPAERRQTVAGGRISREPVDRTAALVISKAPWWAQPIHEKPNPGPTAPPEKRIRKRTHRSKGTFLAFPAPAENGDANATETEPTPPPASQVQPATKPFVSVQEAFERLS